MNIIYRHYKEGDEDQIADLFNRAFQTNFASFLRTPKNWHWRYIQAPGFEPEQIQLAEDSDENKIVGAVMVNLVEKIPINGKDYLTGEINDVSCHPDYSGHGIANKLMSMAIDYMKKKGCDLSILAAAYNGFPRKRIYLKLGYKDIEKICQFFTCANPIRLIRDVPAAALAFPFLLAASYLPRFLNRIRIKLNPFFRDFTYEILYNRKHFEYRDAVNRLIKKNYSGFPIYDKEKTTWVRIKTPSKRFEPTYIIIRKNNKIIGGAAFTHQNFYFLNTSFKIRITITHELFLDKSVFNNKRNLNFGYIYLIDKLLKAATKRSIGGLFFQAPRTDYDLRRGARSMNFFMLKGSVVMIKAMKEDVEIPKPKKPLLIPTYVSTLY
jgi:ribosomal protein S18 acetylase RimI-like enzyme